MIDFHSGMEWADDAACRTVDPELFFPSASGPQSRVQVKAAQEVCARCPVRVQAKCARRALNGDDHYGVWAGVYVTGTAGDRQRALNLLRVIAGDEPVARAVPPRHCRGGCRRMLRSTNSMLVEFPGTIRDAGGWHCRPCLARSKRVMA